MSGGSIGSALGGTAGTLAGAALAPETGGASLLLPAALGAAGGALGGGVGSAASGGGNPWGAAIGGGVTGLLGGLASGLLSPAADAANVGESAAVDAAPAATTAAPIADGGGDALVNSSGVTSSGVALPSAAPANLVSPSTVQLPGGTSSGSGSIGSWLSHLIGGGSGSSGNAAGNVAGTAAKTAASGSGGLSQYLVPAGLGLGALSLLFPQGSNPVNTSNLTNAQNSSNAPLPSYNYNSTSTPYTGSWYTYGQRPQTPMISNTVTPAARGGLMQKFSHGGTVRALAMGGPPMQAPMGAAPQMPPQIPSQGAPPQGMPLGAAPQPPQNPLQQAAQFQMGQRIGQALRQHIKGQGMTPNGIVSGPGKGQDDAIPAKLSQDEYVLPADIPSFLGDGSSKAGGKVLDKFVQDIRKQKTSHEDKFPPKAKNPLSYIHGAT